MLIFDINKLYFYNKNKLYNTLFVHNIYKWTFRYGNIMNFI